jgi:CHAT domain-containing protein
MRHGWAGTRLAVMSEAGQLTPNSRDWCLLQTMIYRDFLIQLRSEGEHYFSACVVSSPAGEDEETLSSELLQEDWSRESPRCVFRDLVADSVVPARRVTPEEMGGQLYRALFQGKVGNLFERSLAQTRAEGCGLRLQIILNPRVATVRPLQGVPWELLFREESGEFLSLSAQTPVVRSLVVPQPGRSAELASRIRVLAAQALPREAAVLELGRELEEMAAAEKHGNLEIVPCRARLTELRETLDEKGPFEVFHYLGHAEVVQGEGALIFENTDGSAERVQGKILAQKLGDSTRLKLLVLNACRTGRSSASPAGNPFGGVAAALVRAGFPAVLAMQEVIPDDAAIALSRALYRKLALRQPIEKALAEARQAVYDLDPQGFEWAVPSLFLRTCPSDRKQFIEPDLPKEEAVGLCEKGVESFWAGDFVLARQSLREAMRRDPSLEKARLFDLLAFIASARPQEAKVLVDLDDSLQRLLEARDVDVSRLAKLTLGILRFDTSGPRGVRVRGITSEQLFADLVKSQRSSLENDLASRLRASRDAKIYFNLRH